MEESKCKVFNCFCLTFELLGGHLECLMYFESPNELQKDLKRLFVIKETRSRPKLFEVMLKLETSLLIEINPQVGDIHCIMVLPEFNPQFVPCSRSDLSSSWDAYLGHVLSMLLGINEMCLPGRFLMWNVSRKLFHYYNNRSKLVCCEIDFFKNCLKSYTSVRKNGAHTQM